MRLLLVTIFFLILNSGYADEATVRFEQANEFYRSGEYKKAAEIYEELLTHRYESPVLYYNLGNTYFKSRNLSAAIVNYERAKRLDPGDEDIDHNLRLAQFQVVDAVEPLPQFLFVRWWRAFVNLYSADQWATLSVICVWSMLAGGLALTMSRKQLLRRIASSLTILALAVFVLSFSGAIQREGIEQNNEEAIVLRSSISVKSAPDHQSTDLFLIHEGIKVTLVDSLGEWRKIRLDDGKVGWLPVESVQII